MTFGEVARNETRRFLVKCRAVQKCPCRKIFLTAGEKSVYFIWLTNENKMVNYMKGAGTLMNKSGRIGTKELILCALFAALTAVLSQVAIPLPMVPINLAMLAVYLAGGVLGARLGVVSQVVYVCLGAVGLPVFSLFRGGIGMILGPTGGYIAGYIAAAAVVGLLSQRWGWRFGYLVVSMVLGLALCYALGTIWFMVITHNTLTVALGMCVLPFLPGDVVKMVVAAGLIPKIRAVVWR